MKKTSDNHMKIAKTLFLSLIIVLNVCLICYYSNKKNYQITTSSLFFLENNFVNTLTLGTYQTSDGSHSITVNDGTVLYDNNYSLTVNASNNGYTLTGKIGKNNKAVTFYQINASTLISGTVMNYTDASGTVYLYDYTAFKLNVEPVVNSNGLFEVWSNGKKVNSYNDLQSAVDAANSGDTIKFTEDYKVTAGAYINKNLTIDGGNHTLDRSEWSNAFLIIEEGVTLNLKNVTIDGGATGFEVDYDAVTFTTTTIPIKSGSDTNDVKQNLSVIITKGNLNADKVNVNNNYTQSSGGAIRVVSGTINVSNSTFNHNRASSGGAIFIGSNFKQNQTVYPIEQLSITNCEFNKNYSSNGGAVYVYNTAHMNIDGTKFISNTVTGGSGGGILINKQGTTAEKLGIDFSQAKINDCLFEDNWVGNDGFAIQNYDAELTTTNTTFKNNVGIHPTTSVATYSMQVIRTEWANEEISNCIFEGNKGSVSGVADHGGHVVLNIRNCEFTKNIGEATMYFLAGQINISDCNFSEEDASLAVVQGSGYSIAEEYEGTDFKGPKTTLDNCTFTNSKNIDVLLRQRSYSTNYDFLKYEVEIKGSTTANIHIWDASNLIITGKLIGDVVTDSKTTSENIIVEKDGKLIGDITYNANTYRFFLKYTYPTTQQISNYDLKVLYLEANKTYTPAEIYLLTRIDNEGYAMKIYTDTTYTTEWDYIANGSKTLYVNWVEHKHTYDGTLILYDNAIYEQCECGYLGKRLTLLTPSNLVYDGKGKAITVLNELGISKKDYALLYYYKKEDGSWEKLESLPTDIGTYKAILTYSGNSIELEYKITEKVKNPNTNDEMTKYVISAIISLISITILGAYKKKDIFNR